MAEIGDSVPARETVMNALDWLEARDKDAYELLQTGDSTYRKLLRSENGDHLIEYMLELERILVSRGWWCDAFKFFYRFGQIGGAIAFLFMMLLLWHDDFGWAALYAAAGAVLLFIGWHAQRRFRVLAVLRLGMRGVHALVSHAAQEHFIEKIRKEEGIIVDGRA
jgi:hypothetical protein